MTQGHWQTALFVEAQHLVKALHLQAGVRQVNSVGVGKVRENPLDFDVFAFEREFLQSLRRVIMHADAFHAGVDLEMHARLDLHGARRRVDLLQAFERGGRHRQVVLQIQRDLVAPNAAQHQDRRLDVQLAQLDALFEHRHADVIHQRGQELRDIDQTVPVGVGLDDGHHPRPAHARADRFDVTV